MIWRSLMAHISRNCMYRTMIHEAHGEFDGLYSLYSGDDYFTHYALEDEGPAYIRMKDPLPTVAECTPMLRTHLGDLDVRQLA